jgi:hypothetical protein
MGSSTRLTQFVPAAQFCGQVSVTVQAPPEAIFCALQEITLCDMPVAAWLGEVRYLPGRLTGRLPDEAPNTQPFMELVQGEGGNIVLAEDPDREIVLGAIGKLHDVQDQQFVPLSGPDAFLRFNQPAYQKLAMSLRVVPLKQENGYRLLLDHRTQALSQSSRWKFALYWLAIKPGGNFVSWLLLRAVKRRAEAMAAPSISGDYYRRA